MEKLSGNALKILHERYLLRNDEGQIIENPAEMFQRVAKTVASAELEWGDKREVEKWAAVFFDMMSNLTFLPNSPTLMNAGLPKAQMSACFVLPVKDSLKSIFDTLKMTALVHQKGGGTGFNFSQLRPEGDRLSRNGGAASGPVSFIKLFDFATEQVKQGGRRRGANMGILNVDHPDILAFVQTKMNGKPLQNFNLSVGITDQFMMALMEGGDWDLMHPTTGKQVRTLPAKFIWDAILKGAWENGNPGLLFLDTIQADNPLLHGGSIWATNPCGEVPLMDFESCNLGSINLSKFVSEGEMDWNALGIVILNAVRFLDNVISINHYPSKLIKNATLATRKIGLGIMGWAEMLIQLNIPYDTVKAVRLAEKVMQFIKEKSDRASEDLAAKRGVFPAWGSSRFYPDRKMRNATRCSIAPTGTISIIADTSSSIEPLFALAFQRKNVLDGSTLSAINPLFVSKLQALDLENHDKVLEKVIENGSCATLKQLPESFRQLFKTAMEIDPAWHLNHQIAFQGFTDNAVSKTINLPSSARLEDIDWIYKAAWKQKAKGITVFRNAPDQKRLLYQGLQKACMKS